LYFRSIHFLRCVCLSDKHRNTVSQHARHVPLNLFAEWLVVEEALYYPLPHMR
jgi:hypothetical protein